MSDRSIERFCNDLRDVAAMIECGERISWGRDVALLREAADKIEKWKHIADTRQEAIEVHKTAYRNLHNDTLGPL